MHDDRMQHGGEGAADGIGGGREPRETRAPAAGNRGALVRGRAQPRAARRLLVAAIDRLLDEGITDYSARTRASRRRMAALYAGFVQAEALLAALRRRGRATVPLDAAVPALVDVARHLLFWATIDGVDDPSAATRAALAGVRRALERVTGRGEGEHAPALLDCERCATPGGTLPSSARGDALCAACFPRARRLRAM
jgi:hypothetical protein